MNVSLESEHFAFIQAMSSRRIVTEAEAQELLVECYEIAG